MVSSEVKGLKSRSRRETESEKGAEPPLGGLKFDTVDPKPSDLFMARLKLR